MRAKATTHGVVRIKIPFRCRMHNLYSQSHPIEDVTAKTFDEWYNIPPKLNE